LEHLNDDLKGVLKLAEDSGAEITLEEINRYEPFYSTGLLLLDSRRFEAQDNFSQLLNMLI